MVKNPPAKAGDLGDAGSIPGLGRSAGLLRLFSFPGVLTLWPAALARHREPFSTFSGSAPSLQSPCFRPQALSAGGTRPGTQTVAPGLLRIHPPPPLQKKKASGDSRERCAARPRLRCCSVGGLARPGERRGVEAAGATVILCHTPNPNQQTLSGQLRLLLAPGCTQVLRLRP